MDALRVYRRQISSRLPLTVLFAETVSHLSVIRSPLRVYRCKTRISTLRCSRPFCTIHTVEFDESASHLNEPGRFSGENASSRASRRSTNGAPINRRGIFRHRREGRHPLRTTTRRRRETESRSPVHVASRPVGAHQRRCRHELSSLRRTAPLPRRYGRQGDENHPRRERRGFLALGVSFTGPRRQLAGSYAPRWDFRESVVTPTNSGRPT